MFLNKEYCIVRFVWRIDVVAPVGTPQPKIISMAREKIVSVYPKTIDKNGINLGDVYETVYTNDVRSKFSFTQSIAENIAAAGCPDGCKSWNVCFFQEACVKINKGMTEELCIYTAHKALVTSFPSIEELAVGSDSESVDSEVVHSIRRIVN